MAVKYLPGEKYWHYNLYRIKLYDINYIRYRMNYRNEVQKS